MPQIRDPFIHEVSDYLRAVPNNILVTPKARQPTREGKPTQSVMFIDNISLMDAISATVHVDVGFMIGSHIVWSRTVTLAVATYWYWAHPHYTLLSDYQVVARFRIEANNGGGTLEDPIYMNVTGYFFDPYASP
ncbi:hypothetical protein ES703_20336 [subsurface metagenome]